MKIAIIGLGYVGLPLSLQFTSCGVSVLGLDVDEAKVGSVRAGRSYIKHIPDETIRDQVETGRLEASSDLSRVKEVEAIIVCVPTPLNKYREPDISHVLMTGKAIAPYIGAEQAIEVPCYSLAEAQSNGNGARESNGSKEAHGLTGTFRNRVSEVSGNGRAKLVVLESTSYPGTTDEDLRAVLEEGSGLKAGEGFHLAFSPEREDPGNPLSKVASIPKVVGGYTPECRERALALYGMAVENLVPVSSCRAAEATKLLENIFRSVNIALVNELKMIYEAMGIDIWEVIEAARTKPFGYMAFYPGPGLGGHCIPIDPFYLTWKAREFGQHTRFIELAGEVNAAMPMYVVRKVITALNRKSKAVRGSRILVIGLAYKANVDDMRQSPAFALMDALHEAGAMVAYFDPWIPEIPPTTEHPHWAEAESVKWNEATISSFDCVVISTAHASVDYTELASWSDCIVDTRDAMAKAGIRSENVFKA